VRGAVLALLLLACGEADQVAFPRGGAGGTGGSGGSGGTGGSVDAGGPATAEEELGAECVTVSADCPALLEVWREARMPGYPECSEDALGKLRCTFICDNGDVSTNYRPDPEKVAVCEALGGRCERHTGEARSTCLP
jgi:hypothetical protein